MPSHENRPTVLFIGSADELQYPCLNLLEKTSISSEWVSSLEELSTSPIENPVAVVVDIDPMTKPLEPHLEKLRFQFPKSDLVAISSSDSASTALLVIRSGFSDFLLKPLSPEELIWALKKVLQRRELFQKIEDPETNLVRALTQISSCSTPSLTRLSTLEFLQSFFKSEGAAWISLQKPDQKVLCSYPKGTEENKIKQKLAQLNLSIAPPPAVTWSDSQNTHSVFITCFENSQAIVAWGIPEKVDEDKLLVSKTLLEHSELSLLNLQKFDEIKHLTFTDELTGLYNSRYLKYALTNTINRAKNKNRSFGVLFIDVDHFKSINTQHGHLVGSEFLIAIGKSIKHIVREVDLVFRYGGDEFIVILSDSDINGAKMIAERIRIGIERRLFAVQGLKLQTTVSIGIAMYPDHAKSQESLLKLADEAMYSAKERSRNTVHFYEAS